MVSGALLQRFCPDNGQCGDRTPDSDGSDAGSAAAQAGRRLLALLSHSGSGSSTSSTGGGPRRWLGGMAAAAAAPLLGAVSGDAAPGPVPGGSYCDGRRLWAIVGAITVSSPLLVLFTQVLRAGLSCSVGAQCMRGWPLQPWSTHPSCTVSVGASSPPPSLSYIPGPFAPSHEQHWLRPDPRDFHKLDAVTQGVRYVWRPRKAGGGAAWVRTAAAVLSARGADSGTLTLLSLLPLLQPLHHRWRGVRHKRSRPPR